MQSVTAYLATAAVFLAIDLIWLSAVATEFYRRQIGHLLAGEFNLPAAGIFYLFYVAGIVFFAVAPALAAGDWTTAAINGALFGFFCYATYDFTNLATLRDWPVAMVVVDVAWGTTLTGLSATLGYLLTRLVY
ncbi:MAG: DUF2177 family protein [Rhizobiales bacterium]|nr:DUF2177 family protein [Hyphomicrobiales bacterium]